MTNGWRTTPLGEVVRLQRGHDLPKRVRVAGDVPVISSGGYSGSHSEKIADGPGVILGRATNLGRPFWSDGPYWPLNTTLYVKDFMGNDPRFIFHLFESLDLSGFNSGSVQPMLNRNYISMVPINLPRVEEQRRIATVLGAIDDLIEVDMQIVKGLNRIYHLEWQRRFGRLQDAEGGPKMTLADLCTTQYGFTESASTEKVGPHFLRVADINKSDWVQWDTVPYCAIPESKFEKYRLHAGDLLVARMADPGKSAIVDAEVDAVFASYLVRLVPMNAGTTQFLFGYLKSEYFSSYARGAITGSVQKNMNAKIIVGAPVVLPDTDALSSFEAFAVALRDSINGLLAEIRDSRRARDELLPLLMSGSVSAAEVTV